MSAFRGGLILAIGNMSIGVMRLLRNLLVARLLGVEDYGIASTFMVAVSFVEMTGDLSLRQLIVQDRDGDRRGFVAGIQGLEIARGLLIATALFLMAGSMARFFGNPQLTWAYQLLALIPMVRGFEHLDVTRLQRSLRFGPVMLVQCSKLGLSLLMLWPLALWLGDYRVMLLVYVVEVAVEVSLTHAIAERRFRIGWKREIAGRALRFGWPLMLSGLLAFLTMNGDRIIVANQFGARELGLFSAALVLTMTPISMVRGLARTFFLPVLSRVQDNPDAFEQHGAFTLQTMLCAGVAAMLGFALAGESVFRLVFGAGFAAGAGFVGLLAILFGLVLVQEGATTIAIARGTTLNLPVATMARIAALPIAFVVALHGGSVVQVILIGIVGQLVSLAISIVLLRAWSGVQRLDRMALPYGLGLALTGACLWLSLSASGGWIPAAVAITLFFALFAACPELARRLRQMLRPRAHDRGATPD